ncbi:hypothetical protein GQ55_3G377400 [Panicum hallii var. hallii]|uniref:non-specific serine/threonine protein kinase n=1 Tax=Panicum hallii var. hallii TaxID=1504633 RepID=A0A2T7EGA1_9POAL|nr:hypothetical protein GQ55_3G377400 [Panicum hallii var. hallii]
MRQQNQKADVPDVLIAPQPRLRILSSQQPASSFSAFPFPSASICPTASSRGAAGRAPLLLAGGHPGGAPPRPRRRRHSRLLQPPHFPLPSAWICPLPPPPRSRSPEVEGRNKKGRAGTEREILEAVDHPFLPQLYGVAEGDRWSCLLTEFCLGGDLHVLCQRQPH